MKTRMRGNAQRDGRSFGRVETPVQFFAVCDKVHRITCACARVIAVCKDVFRLMK